MDKVDRKRCYAEISGGVREFCKKVGLIPPHMDTWLNTLAYPEPVELLRISDYTDYEIRDSEFWSEDVPPFIKVEIRTSALVGALKGAVVAIDRSQIQDSRHFMEGHLELTELLLTYLTATKEFKESDLADLVAKLVREYATRRIDTLYCAAGSDILVPERAE